MGNSIPPAFEDRHDAYAALRVRSFRLYFIGNVIATFGMQMQTMAVGWDIYARTGSELMLGFVGLVQFLPSVVLTLVVGNVADRVPRQRILAYSVSAIACASAGLSWISYRQADYRLIFLCLLLVGIARAFLGPAKASLLPQLVSPEQFSNAVTWHTSGFHLSSVLGPALGGFVIYGFGSATIVYVFDVAACMYFVAMIVLLRLRRGSPAKPPPGIREIVAGFTFVRRHPIILGAISLDMFAVLLGGATTLLPVYAADILHTGARGFGWMRAAPAVGALATSMVLAHRPPMLRAGRVLLWSVIGFGVATIVFGISRNFYLSLAMLLLTGAFDNISVVIRHTLIQTLTPDAIRGRVSAVNSLFIGASNELGGFESGLVASWFGPVVSVVSGGIGTILVVMGTGFAVPALRDYGRLGSGAPLPTGPAEPSASANQSASEPVT